MISKSFFYSYIFIASLLSIYFLVNSPVAIFISVGLLIVLFFLVKGLTKSNFKMKIVRVCSIAMTIGLLYILLVITSLSGFNSRGCYEFVTRNVFTGKIEVPCNFPPWYKKILEGDGEELREAVLSNCLKMYNNSFPEFCEVYKKQGIRFMHNSSDIFSLGYYVYDRNGTLIIK